MLVSQLPTAYLFVGLSLFVLGFLLSRQGPLSTALRCVAVVTGILGVASLALAFLLWMESRFHDDTAQVPVSTCAESHPEARRRAMQQRAGEPVRPRLLPSRLHRVELAVFVISAATLGTS